VLNFTATAKDHNGNPTGTFPLGGGTLAQPFPITGPTLNKLTSPIQDFSIVPGTNGKVAQIVLLSNITKIPDASQPPPPPNVPTPPLPPPGAEYADHRRHQYRDG